MKTLMIDRFAFQDLVRRELPEVDSMLRAHVDKWGPGEMNCPLISHIQEIVVKEWRRDPESPVTLDLMNRLF